MLGSLCAQSKYSDILSQTPCEHIPSKTDSDKVY